MEVPCRSSEQGTARYAEAGSKRGKESADLQCQSEPYHAAIVSQAKVAARVSGGGADGHEAGTGSHKAIAKDRPREDGASSQAFERGKKAKKGCWEGVTHKDANSRHCQANGSQNLARKDKAAKDGVKEKGESSLDIAAPGKANLEALGKRTIEGTDDGQCGDSGPARKRAGSSLDSRGSTGTMVATGKGPANKASSKRSSDWKAKGPAALCMEATWAFDQVKRSCLPTAFTPLASR